MKKTNRLSGRAVFASLLLCLLALPSLCLAAESSVPNRLNLDDGWLLQSSAKVSERGDILSKPTYRPVGWYPVRVPTTVVAAMVKAKIYPDPTFGTNLRQFPGMDYPAGTLFSKRAMQPNSPFAVPWWYRDTFTLPASDRGKTIWLTFEGINYRADIWLNGQKIADSQTVAGAWRNFEFDVTRYVHPGTRNVLAVAVSAPAETDLAVTFVDWNPMPPDKDMGLFHQVSLSTSGPVALRSPAVSSKVDSPGDDSADLTVTAQAKNATTHTVTGTLRGSVGEVEVAQTVTLDPLQSKDIVFSPADYPQLHFDHPQFWWPTQMGSPHLYPLHMQFDIDGRVSDQVSSHFGIRQITSEVTSDTRRLFRINGKPLLIRGGGWSNDFLLRFDPARLSKELDYVADMRLNTIRLEGRPMPDEFFNETDRRGILVMAGWSCCDFWEQWPKWTAETHAIAAESMRTQMYRLRGHPSLLMWLNGSDNAPPSDQQEVYLKIEKDLLWPNPILSSATAKLGADDAKNGVRMTGPYDYVAPGYWLLDAKANLPDHDCALGSCGGAHGFNTETSPGPAIPPVESLKTMLGSDHLWPIDATWDFHAGGGEFKNVQVYTAALNKRYGTARDVRDYAEKAQLMDYEGERAMFEAYSRNKYEATGVIQWMLNNAWPSMIWHLYDYYLRPGGGYFGTKTALEPLHPLYSYDDRSIWVVSSQYHDARDLKLTAAVYNLDMAEKFSRTMTLNATADSTNRLFAIPDIAGLSTTYFLKLKVQDAAGKTVGSNFYWLSTKPETLDWKKSTWYLTPTATFADYTALAQLPKVRLVTTMRTERVAARNLTHIFVRNPGKSLAFFVRLKLRDSRDGAEILPVLWEDNYISLLPGESREITATYETIQPGSQGARLDVQGWNVN